MSPRPAPCADSAPRRPRARRDSSPSPAAAQVLAPGWGPRCPRRAGPTGCTLRPPARGGSEAGPLGCRVGPGGRGWRETAGGGAEGRPLPNPRHRPPIPAPGRGYNFVRSSRDRCGNRAAGGGLGGGAGGSVGRAGGSREPRGGRGKSWGADPHARRELPSGPPAARHPGSVLAPFATPPTPTPRTAPGCARGPAGSRDDRGAVCGDPPGRRAGILMPPPPRTGRPRVRAPGAARAQDTAWMQSPASPISQCCGRAAAAAQPPFPPGRCESGPEAQPLRSQHWLCSLLRVPVLFYSKGL